MQPSKALVCGMTEVASRHGGLKGMSGLSLQIITRSAKNEKKNIVDR